MSGNVGTVAPSGVSKIFGLNTRLTKYYELETAGVFSRGLPGSRPCKTLFIQKLHTYCSTLSTFLASTTKAIYQKFSLSVHHSNNLLNSPLNINILYFYVKPNTVHNITFYIWNIFMVKSLN